MNLKKIKWYQSYFIMFKIKVARIIVRFLPKNKKPIVLVGGNLGEKYEDNASIFHKYLIETRKDLETYWMYDQNFDYTKVKNIPNSIPLGSFKNYLLFFQANYTFHGHSIIYDLAPHMDKYIHHNKKTTMTHISHGIEGFKKILIQKEDVPLLQRTDFFNCASQYERNIKLNGWKFPEEKLITTGMARFDRLVPDSPAPRVRNILFMMTWREWLFDLTEEEFINSDYFQHFFELLNEFKIQNLISNYQLNIKVVLHPFMKNFEEVFKILKIGDRVQFASFDEVSLKDEVIASDMLLTDYSSISWDFLYQNKPIIFYMFDQHTLEEKRGTYLNLNEDLYGYKAKNVTEVARLLQKIVAGKNINPWYQKSSYYFDYFDQHNCERLANTVIGPPKTY